jgi:hypothetical protein
MSNAFVEGLFLLAFWAPPLVVAACALSLFIEVPAAQRSSMSAYPAPAIR